MRKNNLETKFYLYISIIILLIISFLEIYMMLNLRDIIEFALNGKTKEVTILSSKIIRFLLILLPLLIISLILKLLYINRSSLFLERFYLRNQLSHETKIFETENPINATSILINKIGLVEKLYFTSKFEIISSIMGLISGIIIVVTVDWKIILVSIILIIILLFGISILSKKITKKIDDISNDYDSYTNFLKSVTKGMHTIKFNKLEMKTKENFEDEVLNFEEDNAQMKKISLKINIFIQIITSIFLFVIFLVILILVWNQYYKTSQVIFILSSFTLIVVPSIKLFSNFPDAKAGKTEFDKIIKTSNKKTIDGNEIFRNFNNKIEFKNISFQYDDNILFENINFSILKNRKYLILGSSGVGKTTLLELIRRKENPISGEIMIDNKNIINYNFKSYLSHISYVSQNVFLFNATLRNNITLFKNIDDDKISTFLHKFNLSEFVSNLNYMIENNGSNLSSGQKMRISILRELIKDKNLLLLDEIFANLDEENSLKIEEILLSLKNNTIINISHVINVENILKYDYIILIENKKVEIIKSCDYIHRVI